MRDELREQLADVQHAIWAHWMRWQFTCGQFNEDETWTMPAVKVQRWQRQMNTPYAELTDQERESDREQADKVLAVLEQQRAPTAKPDLRRAREHIQAVYSGFGKSGGKIYNPTFEDDLQVLIDHAQTYLDSRLALGIKEMGYKRFWRVEGHIEGIDGLLAAVARLRRAQRREADFYDFEDIGVLLDWAGYEVRK